MKKRGSDTEKGREGEKGWRNGGKQAVVYIGQQSRSVPTDRHTTPSRLMSTPSLPLLSLRLYSLSVPALPTPSTHSSLPFSPHAPESSCRQLPQVLSFHLTLLVSPNSHSPSRLLMSRSGQNTRCSPQWRVWDEGGPPLRSLSCSHPRPHACRLCCAGDPQGEEPIISHCEVHDALPPS